MKRMDPAVYLLAFMVVFFTAILIYVEFVFKSDGQIFQVICGMLTGFGGALLLRLKPQGEREPAAGTTTTVITPPLEVK